MPKKPLVSFDWLLCVREFADEKFKALKPCSTGKEATRGHSLPTINSSVEEELWSQTSRLKSYMNISAPSMGSWTKSYYQQSKKRKENECNHGCRRKKRLRAEPQLSESITLRETANEAQERAMDTLTTILHKLWNGQRGIRDGNMGSDGIAIELNNWRNRDEGTL